MAAQLVQTLCVAREDDKIVSADMPFKIPGGAAQVHGLRQKPEHVVPAGEAVGVVVRLKIVQIKIDDRAVPVVGNHLFNRALNGVIAGQPRERIRVRRILYPNIDRLVQQVANGDNAKILLPLGDHHGVVHIFRPALHRLSGHIVNSRGGIHR